MTMACSKFKLHHFYCAQRKWSVLLVCTIFGTKSARLSVSAEDAEAANILDEEFWPDNITARPWKFPPRLGRPDTEVPQTTSSNSDKLPTTNTNDSQNTWPVASQTGKPEARPSA